MQESIRSGTEEENTKPFWGISLDEVFREVNSSKNGLTEKEVEERVREVGKNSLPENGRGQKTKIFLRQFKSPLIIILMFAGFITLAVGDIKDSAFIFAAVMVNSTLGFYQENKAEQALAKLKTYIKERVRVIRGGKEKEIDAHELVPGDVIKLTAGNRVPADGRLFMVNEFSANEAVLTGESLPVKKSVDPVAADADLADQKSMVFSGTLVSEGTALAVVVRTGKFTELGKIAELVSKAGGEETPLQSAIRKFSLRSGILLLLFTLILFSVGIYLGTDIFEMFLVSVAVAVSAVPEGLPIALTVILAVGVERLAKEKGVVRKLLAAETLGSTTVILTDKTGTLTEARMKLAEIVSDRDKGAILRNAMLASDVAVENPESEPEKWRVIGRPLESAIVRSGAQYEVFLSDIIDKYDVVERKPFNSSDKYSAVKVKANSKTYWVYLGAPDILIEKFNSNKKEKRDFLEKIDELAYSGYRLLGLAVGKEFWGLLAFNDPVREGVAGVIEKVANAGVKTVIATGDHKGTAISVAKKLNILASNEEVLTGRQIEEMSDEDLETSLPKIKIFARVTPSDKLRIANLYKKRGEVVAVTGDGVNDAPALQGADIGVAVGSGTDVAKEAADLVILDDNFETIVKAIEEGRRILENIRKVLVYLLTDVFDELVLIGGAIFLGIPIPLTALQILWVNFFDDSFPAIALAFEREKDTLKTSPVNLKKRLIDGEMRFLILIIGSISSIFLFAIYVYYLGIGYPLELVRTFIFASFAVYSLFLAFSVKSLHKSIFSYNPFDNPYLIGGVLIGLFLTAIAVYVPFFQDILGTVSLSLEWVVRVIGVGVANIAAIELGKIIFIHPRMSKVRVR